ncbi:MAG: glycosyltransferase family 2 protein [Candidatus Omnitrophota bacterium]|nr:MAG: glycosyltransferase family 2 protein [Candidatus Omnitrophota bacterium]
MPLISIIITNYNGRKYLGDCIDSLNRNSLADFEIIVVDNGSCDGSVEFLRVKYSQVKVIALDSNLGLAIASNRGRAAAAGKYLFFYNNDTIADQNLLSELVKTMESDETIGICGCKTLSYDGAKKTNCGVPLDIFGYPYGESKCFYVDAAIFIRREVFDEIGGFDPKLFLYCEDRDLCWRCWLYGYKVVAVDSAVFRHDSFCAVDGEGRLNTNIRKRFMGEAFTIRLLLKNYSFLALLGIFPIYMAINCMEMLLFLFKGRLDVVFGAYIRAYGWNLGNLLETLRLRRKIQSERKTSDISLLKKMYLGSGKLKLFGEVGVPQFR